ncbi:MAG: segregation/condensation protein A [Treponema sp.]|jgi:segregation and condensation protein A|nr:segregation/condensation protein A [Treponema sp.]
METLQKSESIEQDSLTNFKLGQFEGPLDLLLYLIKKNEINIYDIPIGEITEQYLDYLDYTVSTDLDNLTDFYLLASDLLHIKSRMLLPVKVSFEDEDIEDPRQELVDKLIEYQKFKKLSELMEQKEEENEWSFERKKNQRILPFEDEELWEKVDAWDLLKIFSKLISTFSSEKILDIREDITISEKMTLMNEFFENQGECLFTDLIVREGNLLDVVCAFMAILEAVKLKIAVIYQNRMFGDIKLKPTEKE